jgi:ribosomal protein L28
MNEKLRALYAGFRTFQRANRGLYGGEMIRYGDTVSEMGNRNRRTFKPNTQYVYLYSEQLQQKLRVRLSVNVLQKIDEAGGLDNYILNQPFPESWFAEKIKYQILMNKFEKEREEADETVKTMRLKWERQKKRDRKIRAPDTADQESEA